MHFLFFLMSSLDHTVIYISAVICEWYSDLMNSIITVNSRLVYCEHALMVLNSAVMYNVLLTLERDSE